ncbi:TPA: hypothetical protein ACS8CD_003108 [Providencia alcalifaciens]
MMSNKLFDEVAIKGLIESLFADNKSPMDAFGLNWDQFVELERLVPEIVTKMSDEDNMPLARCAR